VRKHVIKGGLFFIVPAFESKNSDGIKDALHKRGEKNSKVDISK
jgi:hypothetical protein